MIKHSRENSPRGQQKKTHRNFKSVDFTHHIKESLILEDANPNKTNSLSQQVSKNVNLLNVEKSGRDIIIFRPPSLLRSTSVNKVFIKRNLIPAGHKKRERHRINLSMDFTPFDELTNMNHSNMN